MNRDVAVAPLAEAGLMVETAENGRVAVDKVTGSLKEFYDAVRMDIQMPVMDGYNAKKSNSLKNSTPELSNDQQPKHPSSP